MDCPAASVMAAGGAMKEQYVGDENDYRKYALLRHLSSAGRIRIGLCWILTPPDDRPDGGKVAYLDDPDRWRGHDPELFDALKSVRSSGGARRLRMIERRGILPGALFFTEHLSDRADLRRAYFEAALGELMAADLIFFDPDNGLDVSSMQRGHAGLSKYVYRDEIERTYDRGLSILVYQHFPHQKREQFIARLGPDLLTHAPQARLWCFRTPQIAFVLLAHPRHSRELTRAAEEAAKRWKPEFMTGEPLTP